MRRTAILLGLSLVLATGCADRQPKAAPAEASAIPVSLPVQREVTDYVDFTGRTDAVESVDIRARVTGYLMKMPFKEGSEVKAGDPLFEIDPRPYQAQYEQAQGQVQLYKSSLKLATISYQRDLEIGRTPGAISQQELDRDRAAVEEADARVKAFQASLDIYKLNLDFCTVKSPIAGRISRYYLTKGNLVNQDQTLLTTIVSLDPMYVYFDMDESTLLRIRKEVNAGRIQLSKLTQEKVPVLVGLQGEAGYPHVGEVNFFNNQVNAGTGSISVRGVLDNPSPANGVRLLSPGMFVRVRLPIGQPHKALLVIDRAIASDQNLKYVYVVDAAGQVEQRRVLIGALQEDGLRVIEPDSELKATDRVVVGALQQVRVKMTVRAEEVQMPTFNRPSVVIHGKNAP